MLSPEEIENREFLVSLRGFDRAEVRQFLAEVADMLREQSAAGGDMQAPAEPGPADPGGVFAEIGQQTQRILEAARDAAGDITAKARADGEREVEAAREEAARIVAAGEQRRDEIEAVVADLRARRDELTASLRDVGRTIEGMVAELAAPGASDAGAAPVPGVAVASSGRVGSPDAEPPSRRAAAPSPAPAPSATAPPRAAGAGDPDPRVLRAEALESLQPALVRAIVAGLRDVHDLVVGRLPAAGDDASALPPRDELGARLAALAGEPLSAAYRAGRVSGALLAGWAGTAGGDERTDLPAALADDAAEQLHARLADALARADEAGPAERVGAVLSELELAEELAATHLARAYELGQLDEWAAGGVTHRRWVLGREPRCPEARCRVNDEGAPVAVGTAFRSGDDSPPVHVGCTCTTVPALASESGP